MPTVPEHLKSFGLAFVVAGLCMGPALGACVVLAGTADGSVTVSAMRAEPQPYWRGRVSENMMHRPDIVTEKSYTICWQGVVSTYVCTSGAQVCW
jgi:hypothetical protein